MPGFNGTGPNGAGPMTGRGMGSCAGNNLDARGFGAGRGLGSGAGRGMGRGLGRGAGKGAGRRGCGYASAGFRFGGWPAYEPTEDQKKEILNNQANFLENELKVIHDEINRLSNTDNK